ncbi:hypothetical protein ACJ72_03231 [Emergomyces africanus]|uniref:Uncharacterized protein n=1 Tax=Emergomyces africanus TaxID=1955775 RepID=A0A1B7P074_9EURO|nr:hypothetical protein ACJ72_03231 [Emergomyces africanus]
MEFEEILKVSEVSFIFHVNYCGKPWDLKLFHNNGTPGYACNCIQDLDRSCCEIRAYYRLKQFKICDVEVMPDFYGFILR